MELNQEFDNLQQEEEGINWREIIQIVLGNWHWFVLSVFVCLSAAFIYLQQASEIYPVSYTHLTLPTNSLV